MARARQPLCVGARHPGGARVMLALQAYPLVKTWWLLAAVSSYNHRFTRKPLARRRSFDGARAVDRRRTG
jgi:hypothetical protein